MRLRHQSSTRWLLTSLLVGTVLAGTPARATTLSATLWADVPFEAYLSLGDAEPGALFLKGDGGQEGSVTSSVELVEGVIHFLHIVVDSDSSDPSALIGSFTFDDFGFIFPNFADQFSTDADHWTLSRAGFGHSYEFIKDLGPNGTAPWGTHPDIAPEARYLWSDSDSGKHYFSVALLPTNSTARRFTVGLQPLFNNLDGILTETLGVPYQLAYREDHANALALAYPGRIGARVEESPPHGASDAFTAAWAEYDSPDFILSTTGSATEAEISLNFQLRGTLSGGAGLADGPAQISTATSQLDIYTRIDNEPIYFGRGTVTARHDTASESPTTEVIVTKIFSLDFLPDDIPNLAQDFPAQYHLEIDRSLTTPSYTIEVGTPFSVKLSAALVATAASDHGVAVSRNDFTGGIHFPASGPVFNLPPGFTVDSISGLVRNNRFEGPLDSGPRVPAAGLFMHIQDTPGESPINGYEDWIDLLHAGSGLYRQTGGQAWSILVHKDISIVKRVDKSSPKLAEAVAQGKFFEEVVIESNRSLPQNRWEQIEYRLQNVLLTKYQIGDDSDAPLPIESLSLNYSYINWTRRILEANGALRQEASAWWDLATNTGGSQSQSADNERPQIEPVENQSVGQGETASFAIQISDTETPVEDLVVTATTATPHLVGDIEISGSGGTRHVHYQTSPLRSGLGSITVKVSDGDGDRSIAVPILVGVEATPYEAYLAAHFPEEQRNDPFFSSPLSDPDLDGLPTLIEFLFGTNPAEFTPSSEALSVALIETQDGRALQVKYRRRLDEPLFVGALWGSPDLQQWQRLEDANPLYEESTQASENPLFEEVDAAISLPPGDDPYFLRFQATAPL